MRKVVLTPNDFEMFDTEIGSVEFEFFHKHKDAFKRMWREQGRKFWIQFVMSYRHYAVEYGTIKDFPAKHEHFEDYVDQAFIVIHENFVEGKFGSAHSFITDIVLVAQHRHTLQYLESKSYAKDPFYIKETRDVFRRLFGPPNEKSSYLKVYILFPIYMKYAGAVCICLRRWLDAEEEDLNPDTSSDQPTLKPKPLEMPSSSSSSSNSPAISDNLDEEPFYAALPGPKIVELHDDDEAVVKEKPVDTPVDREEKGQGDEAESKKEVVKEVKSTAGADAGGDHQYDLPRSEKVDKDADEMMYEEKQHHYMMRRRMMMEERRMEFFEDDEEYFRMYIREVKEGRKEYPSFVKNWPRGANPYVTDPDNPIYDPSHRTADWKSGLKLPDFAKFVRYVRLNYKRGEKMTVSPEKSREPTTIKIEDHKHKESQEERKRKRRLRKKIKKGLPVNKTELTTGKSGPRTNGIPALLAEALGHPVQEANISVSQCARCHEPLVKNAKAGKSKRSQSLLGASGGLHIRPGLRHIQGYREECSSDIDNLTNSLDPRKPYIMDPQKHIIPKQIEPKLVETRKDMDAPTPVEVIDPKSVNLTQKVDKQKGTVTQIVEKKDGKGNTTTETTIRHLGEDDKDNWLEGSSPPILNHKVQREIAAKMSESRMLEGASDEITSCGSHCVMVNKGKKSPAQTLPKDNPSRMLEGASDEITSCGSHCVMVNKGKKSPAQTLPKDPIPESDKLQFREMYQEISSAIGDVSRNNQCDDEPKGSHFMGNHDTRHEMAKKKLRHKLGERTQDRKHPDLPGLVRLGGQVEYPKDENEALMMTITEMGKMNPKEKDFFQERLGRTKYFKDQEDPRDVVDSLGQFLIPGIKDTLTDKKAQRKKAKVREQERQLERKLKEAKMSDKMEDSDCSDADRSSSCSSPVKERPNSTSPTASNHNSVEKEDSSGSQNSSEKSNACENESLEKDVKTTEPATSAEDNKEKDVDTNTVNGVAEEKHEKETDDADKSNSKDKLSMEDLKRVMEYKDDVKRMKEDLHFNAQRMNRFVDRQRKSDSRDSWRSGREFEHQVEDANRELRVIEDKLDFLEEECSNLENSDFTENVQRACDELRHVKRTVKKWEYDAEELTDRLRYQEIDARKRREREKDKAEQKKSSSKEKEKLSDEDKLVKAKWECLGLGEEDEKFFEILMKEAQVTKEELLNELPSRAKQISIDNSYDTHPPGHPEVTKEIIEKSRERVIKQNGKIYEMDNVVDMLRADDVRRKNKQRKRRHLTPQERKAEEHIEHIQRERALLEFREVMKDKIIVDNDFFDTLGDDEKRTAPPAPVKDTKPKVQVQKTKKASASESEESEEDGPYTVTGRFLNILNGDKKPPPPAPPKSGFVLNPGLNVTVIEPNSSPDDPESFANQFIQYLNSDGQGGQTQGISVTVVDTSQPIPRPNKKLRNKPSASVHMPKLQLPKPTDEEIEVMKARLKAETKKEVEPVRKREVPNHLPDAVQRVSYKLSHPVGGRVADKRSPQQKMQEAKTVEKPSPVKAASPEKKAKSKSGKASDTRETKKEKTSMTKGLKVCSACGKTEPSPKTFKKCQKCKDDQIKRSRYYCGRECQADDWRKRHKVEHKENKLE